MLHLLPWTRSSEKRARPLPGGDTQSANGQVPDKEYLYGQFLEGERHRRKWQDQIHQRSTLKALDLAADEMGDVTTTVNKGMGTKELLLIVLLFLLGMGAMNLDKLWPSGDNSQGASPPDSEYNVRFYNKDGELIEIPQKGQEKKE